MQLLHFSWHNLQHYSDFTSPYCSFCSPVHIWNSDYICIDKKSSTLEGVALKGNIPAIRLYLAANGPDVNISADTRDTNSSKSSGDLDMWLLATRQGASISTGPKEKLKDALASLNFLVAEESLQTFNEVMQHLPNDWFLVRRKHSYFPSHDEYSTSSLTDTTIEICSSFYLFENSALNRRKGRLSVTF